MSKISEDFIKEQKEEITAKLKDQQTIKVSAEDFKNYLAQHSVGKKNLNSYLSEVKNKPTIAIITQEALSDIKKDLSNIDLSGSTIIDVQFDDYNLTATNFSNCFLQQLDNGVVFKNCDLTDANFTNANEDIIGKDLQPKVTFYNCKMAGADLRGMNYATGAFEIKDETLNALVQQLLGDNKLLKKDNKTTIEKNYRNLKLSIPNIDALVENSNRYEEIRSKDLQKQDQLKSTLVELEDKIKDTEDKIEKLKSDDTFDMIKANVTEVADKVMDSAKDYFTNLFSNTTQPEAQQQETRLEKLNNIKEDLTTLKTNITKEIDANQTNIDNGLKTIRDTSFDEFISAFKTLNIKENIICDPIFIANDNNAKEVKEKKIVERNGDLLNSFLQQDAEKSLKNYLKYDDDTAPIFYDITWNQNSTTPKKISFETKDKNTDKEITPITIKDKDFSGCIFVNNILNDLNFENCNFNNACLEGANLTRTQFIDCKLNNTKLQNAQAEGAIFKGSKQALAGMVKANFKKAFLEGAAFESVDANGAKFEYANLTNAKIIDSEFKKVNLTGVSAKGLKIQNSKFAEAVLKEAFLQSATIDTSDFNNAVLKAADLSYARVKQSIFNEVEGENSKWIKTIIDQEIDTKNLSEDDAKKALENHISKFVNAKFNESNFDGSIIYNANLSKAKLKYSNFKNAMVKNVYAQGVDLTGSNFDDIRIEDSILGEAILKEVQATKSKWINVNLEKANLQGAKILKANFERINLEKANLQDAKILEAHFEKVNAKEATINNATQITHDHKNDLQEEELKGEASNVDTQTTVDIATISNEQTKEQQRIKALQKSWFWGSKPAQWFLGKLDATQESIKNQYLTYLFWKGALKAAPIGFVIGSLVGAGVFFAVGGGPAAVATAIIGAGSAVGSFVGGRIGGAIAKKNVEKVYGTTKKNITKAQISEKEPKLLANLDENSRLVLESLKESLKTELLKNNQQPSNENIPFIPNKDKSNSEKGGKAI